MPRNVFNNIARGAGIAAVLTMSSFAAQAQTTTIYVGVAANFAAPLNDIISAYKGTHANTDIIPTSASTSVLKGQILPNCHSGPYDLLLGADQAAATAVDGATSGGTDCSIHYPSGNSPFLYATGSLVLWSSPNNSVDISVGLPSSPADFVIADPDKAPYGYAAMQVLNSSPWSMGLTKTGTFSPPVHIQPNIDLTFQEVQAGNYSYGFVAKSQVCHNYGSGEVFAADYTHEYVWNDPAHPYDKIVQYGVAIDRGQGTPELNLLKSFVDYLLTDTTARGIVTAYCYQ